MGSSRTRVDLVENVGTIVNVLGANFVDFDVLDEELQAKAVKPLNAFDVLSKAASTKILPPEIAAEEQANPTEWVELHNHLLQLAKIVYPGAGFPPAEVKSSGSISCSDPVEKQYYSCKKFDLMCCRCGSTELDAPVNEDEGPIQSGSPCLSDLLGKGCQAFCLRTENSNTIRRKEEEEEETLNATSC
ncbi:hypothetical protein AWC38_SpisGene5194 [Stylophora pistillata]|uniref:Uncharacterized protein n=1 Tax=Stylophora pistillata TaxID=50429 RepID=A0A2B4SLI2_STYPI|nr:hypothetical protein AWC38_SpisGene5194 [Stylophora pistillata]